MSKSINGDYGSFSNTPVSIVGASGIDHQQNRGHQRTDSASDASQMRPLLDNQDSSSDDESGAPRSFPFSRQRGRQKAVGSINSGQVEIAIPTEARNDQDGGLPAVNDDENDCDEDDNIPMEPLKTFFAALFMVFGWIATTTSLALTHERVPDVSPLPDIILDNFSYQSWGLDASEICIIVMIWTAFLIVLFHKHRFVVLRRIFLLLGLHYTYRAITMYITVLPKPNPEYECAPKLNQTTAAEIVHRVLTVLSGFGLSINGKHVYCGDYIYSGHTMTLVTAYLVIREYTPKRLFILHWIALLTAVAGVVLLLIARGHYSIDVLIAYVITTRLWWIYHTLVNNESLKGNIHNPHNQLSKAWWWLAFLYFEKNVPCNLPLKFGWPIPKKLMKWRPLSILFRQRPQRFTNIHDVEEPPPTENQQVQDNPS